MGGPSHWGDYNNDGYLDLFISRGSGAHNNGEPVKQTLYRNNGNGTFTEVTDQAGLGLCNGRAAAWGDYNNDGYLDLYVVNSGNVRRGNWTKLLLSSVNDSIFPSTAPHGSVDFGFVQGAWRLSGAMRSNAVDSLELFVTNGEDNTQFIEGPQFLAHIRRIGGSVRSSGQKMRTLGSKENW